MVASRTRRDPHRATTAIRRDHKDAPACRYWPRAPAGRFGYAQRGGTALPCRDFWTWDLRPGVPSRQCRGAPLRVSDTDGILVTDRLTRLSTGPMIPGNPGQGWSSMTWAPTSEPLPRARASCSAPTAPSGGRHPSPLDSPVPAAHTDPVATTADLYGWPVEAYRRLRSPHPDPQRRSPGGCKRSGGTGQQRASHDPHQQRPGRDRVHRRSQRTPMECGGRPRLGHRRRHRVYAAKTAEQMAVPA